MRVLRIISLVLLLVFTACGPKERFHIPSPNVIAAPSMLRGYDVLGVAKQDCSFIAQTIDSGTAFGELLGTFGDVRPCLTEIFATNKILANRFHAIDGTVNGHACAGNVVSLSFLIKKLQIMKTFAANYPTITWYGSPVLEHGCRDKKIVDNWFTTMKRVWPELIPVCSGLSYAYCPPGILKEIHGGGKGDITSNDGVSLFDSDVSFLTSGKRLTLGWTNCMNGRVTGEKTKPVPPTQRKNWCSKQEIRQVVLVMRDPQTRPTISGCRDIVKPELLKSNAEYYGIDKDDGRGNKPLLILNKKYSRISLQTIKNAEVAFMKYYGLLVSNTVITKVVGMGLILHRISCLISLGENGG